LRAIGGDPKRKEVINLYWKLASQLVPTQGRSGSFNQSLMELGATVCTIQNPVCHICPVKMVCHAFQEVQVYEETLRKADPFSTSKRQPIKQENLPTDNNGNIHHNVKHGTDGIDEISSGTSDRIQPGEYLQKCSICSGDWEDISNSTQSVTRYPRKVKKSPQREETMSVCVIEREHSSSSSSSSSNSNSNENSDYLIVQRPDNGLLASLWEFPQFEITTESDDQPTSFPSNEKLLRKKALEFLEREKLLNGILLESIESHRHVGILVHLFSHIRQTLVVQWIRLRNSNVIDLSQSFNSEKTSFTALPITEPSPKQQQANQNIDTDTIVTNTNNKEKPYETGTRILRWVTASELNDSAISKSVKKCFELVKKFKRTSNSSQLPQKTEKSNLLKGKKRKTELSTTNSTQQSRNETHNTKQQTLQAFFKKI